MGAPAIVQNAFASSANASVTSLTATFASAPSNTQHILVAVVVNGTSTPTSIGPSTPTGWTQKAQSSGTAGVNIGVYVHQVQGGDPASYTFTLANGASKPMRISLFETSGGDLSTIVNAAILGFVNNGLANNMSATPTVLECLPISVLGTSFGAAGNVVPPSGWTNDYTDTHTPAYYDYRDAPTTSLAQVTAAWSYGIASPTRGLLLLLAPSYPAFSTSAMNFTSPSASPQTATLTGGTGTVTITNSDPTVASWNLVGTTLTVQPIDVGNTTITATDANGNTASILVSVYGPLVVSPTELTFGNAPLGATLTIDVYEPGYLGTITATSSNAGVATVVPASDSGQEFHQFVVSWVATGNCTVTINDGHNTPVVVTVAVTGLPTTTTGLTSTGQADVQVTLSVSATGAGDLRATTTALATGQSATSARKVLTATGAAMGAGRVTAAASGAAMTAQTASALVSTGAGMIKASPLLTARGAGQIGASGLLLLNAVGVAVLLGPVNESQTLDQYWPIDPYIFSQG